MLKEKTVQNMTFSKQSHSSKPKIKAAGSFKTPNYMAAHPRRL
jgi:hypothetical protein